MGLALVLLLWVRVKLGVMIIKEYSTLPKSPEVKPHHQI